VGHGHDRDMAERLDEPGEEWQGDGDWVPTEYGPRILPDTPDRVCTVGDGLPLPSSPNVKRGRRTALD
jgi:hypothetical protein